MSSIVLATLNARYHHCAFGLRYLFANMGELRGETALTEFTINQPTLEILDAILSGQPKIVGLGVYIWNADETLRLVLDLKRVAPWVIVVLGGPEVSYETEHQEICQLADYVIAGEADLAFPALCRDILGPAKEQPVRVTAGRQCESEKPKIVHAAIPGLSEVVLPYDLYSEEDIAHRVIYVEASRGCPFTCEFCLSALDIPVRQFPLDAFLSEMEKLLNRGARIFKFVDRTFNLNIRTSRGILEFFLARYQSGMFLHFELIPDRLPDALKEVIVQFPPGALQFEVGIQTFNEDVSELISRRQDNLAAEQNLSWLMQNTSVHVHADLIVGLPGESLESLAAGFDRLVRLAPHEIQVGMLKRLRGTPIVRHDETCQMVYSPHAPYEILQNRLLDFSTIQALRRFAKYWDTIVNSGNFVESSKLLWDPLDAPVVTSSPSVSRGSPDPAETRDRRSPSPFASFRHFSNWLFQREGQSHGISLGRLVELMFEYLTDVRALTPQVVANVIWSDYQRGGRSDKPACLVPYLNETAATTRSASPIATLKRQRRRLAPDVPSNPETSLLLPGD